MRRRPKHPAAPTAAAAPLPVSGARRGRVTLRERIARRRIVKVLSAPAAAPLVAVAVVAVFAALVVGTVLGAVLAGRETGAGEW